MSIWKELHKILETHDTVDCSMLGYMSMCEETGEAVVPYSAQQQALANGLVIVAASYRSGKYTLQKKGTVSAYYHGPCGVLLRIREESR